VFRGKSAFYADVPRVRRCAKMRHWFLSAKSRLPRTYEMRQRAEGRRETGEKRWNIAMGKQVRFSDARMAGITAQ
jgi:hypothetical protein